MPSDDNQGVSPGLQFVVLNGPNDAGSAANRRRVRSQAALKSWPGRRKRTLEQAEDAGANRALRRTTNNGHNKVPTTSKVLKQQRQPQNQPPAEEYVKGRQLSRPMLNSNTSLESIVSGQTASDYSAPATPASATSSPGVLIYHSDSINGDWEHEEIRKRARIVSKAVPREARKGSKQVIKVEPHPMSPEPPIPSGGMADPFNCYPVPHKPWFDQVLHHMLTVFAPRGWPALKITTQEGLDWENFMHQHALAEPALFYVRLLFATGDMIKLGVMNREVTYWLQSQAIQAINEALQDPQRASSIPLILAVGRIALHECLYGDRQAAHTMHRPAQARMIHMRGGMKALDMPPLVKRLMRWSDTVMAKQGGTVRLLEDDETDANFTAGQSVNVLEKWAPEEGKALRKKMNIKDMLND